jgi:hypothetical protein
MARAKKEGKEGKDGKDGKEIEVGREVKVRIIQEKDEVVLAFGELVAWVSLNPLAAIELADNMKKSAEDILRSDA